MHFKRIKQNRKIYLSNYWKIIIYSNIFTKKKNMRY